MSSQPHPSLLCWHQPVAPFVIQQGRHPRIGLWLQAELWPEQVLLRCEPDNEERLVTMVPQGEVAGYRHYQATLPLHQASSRQA